MTAEPWFVDTNVFVYMFDNHSPRKQARARELLVDYAQHIILSTQVLGEFYVTVTRKFDKPLPAADAMEALDDLCAFPVRPLRTELVRSAVRRSASSQLSYWDALIIESAIDGGATVLLTEDLQHGRTFAGLQIVNPFRADALRTL